MPYPDLQPFLLPDGAYAVFTETGYCLKTKTSRKKRDNILPWKTFGDCHKRLQIVE